MVIWVDPAGLFKNAGMNPFSAFFALSIFTQFFLSFLTYTSFGYFRGLVISTLEGQLVP